MAGSSHRAVQSWMYGLLNRRTVYQSPESKVAARAAIQLDELEPRLCFSAMPIAPQLFPDQLFATLGEQITTNTASSPDADQSLNSTQLAQAQPEPLELFFIDAQVANQGVLIDGLRSQFGDQAVYHVLDADQDGINQITQILQELQDVAAIHIVSHGSPGQVQLGNTSLSEASLTGYAAELSSWQDALDTAADILFYGCDLASTESGQTLIAALGQLTGADIAASVDQTGHTALQANWNLEFSVGVIETSIPWTPETQDLWLDVLSTAVVAQYLDSDGTPIGTLKDAAPTGGGPVPDFDGDDGEPGLKLKKTGDGFSESDDLEFQLWHTGSGNFTVDGPVNFTFYSAMKDWDASETGGIHAYLVDVADDGSDAQILAEGTVARSTWSGTPNVWEEDTINFGVIADHHIAAGRALGVKVIVDDAFATDDMWFAYDTAAQQSRLEFTRRDALVVTNTLDDFTVGSLRWAIDQANTTAGLDVIEFDISGASHTIAVSSVLNITDSVIIDAESEPDFAGTPIVVLDGSASPTIGLHLAANDSVIAGLVISGFGDAGMLVSGSDNTVQHNYVGTNAAGTVAVGNANAGISISGDRNQILNNLISGNDDNGLFIATSATANQILGNYIGTNANGTAALGNRLDGIWIEGSNNMIGGATVGAGNVISGNLDEGISIDSGGSGNVIQGNFIGTDAAASVDLGNAGEGVLILGGSGNIIGGTAAGEANTIAYSGGSGVAVDAGSQHTIRGNSIFSNSGPGIDLLRDGTTLNDTDDPDAGPNNLQNYPVLIAAKIDGGGTKITGTLNSEAGKTFEIDFYGSNTSAANGHGDAQSYLGSTTVVTDSGGDAYFFNIKLASSAAAGSIITATATESASGDTSEFSQNIVVDGGSLWLSTTGATTDNNAPQGSWDAFDVVSFGAPGPTYGEDSTSGHFANPFSFADNIRALHYVNTVTTVQTGGGTPYDLQPGQIVLSFRNSTALPGRSGPTLNVDNRDVVVYTPTTGKFEILLDDKLGVNVHAISIVEQPVDIGVDTTLQAGTYLIAHSGLSDHDNVYTYVGATGGEAPVLLLDGSDPQFGVNGSQIQGLEFLEEAVTLGDTPLAAHSLLITVDDPTVSLTGGATGDAHDIFALTINATEQDTVSATDVTASLLFDGDDVGLSGVGEEINAISVVQTLVVPNDGPVANDDAYSTNEDSPLDSNDRWFDSNWSHRRNLSFNNLAQSENLTDFPVLVTLDATRIDYGQTRNDGHDLRFVDGDGNLLAHEIEYWDKSGTSYVWVKVPEIVGSSDTDFIWMYYGNPTAANGEDAANVWGADYQAVWHLNETSGNHQDSTANNQNLNVAAGGVNKDASGKIDGADEFDGFNEYLQRSASDAPLQITGDLTLEAWIRMDSYPGDSAFDMGTDAAVIEFGGFGDGNSADNYLYALIVQNNGDVALGHESGPGTNHYQDMGVSLGLNEWYQLTAVRDATAREWNLFLDGAPIGSTFSYSTNPNGGSNADLFIGWDHTYFDGIIDEVRVQDSVRSADWIAAQYASTTDDFITYGKEQSAAGVLDNDLDTDGDALTIKEVNGNAGDVGTQIVLSSGALLTLDASGRFDYDPNGQFEYLAVGETASDTFDYTVSDGYGGTDTATVTVTIIGADDDPLAGDDSITVAEGGTANTLDGGFASVLNDDTDPDLSDALSVNTTPVSGPSFGALILNSDGTFSYTHDGSENFSDSFIYELMDANGGATDTATVTIAITPVNENDPVVPDKSFTVTEGGTANEGDLDSGTSLLFGLTDADLPFDSHTVNTTVVTGPSHGGLTLNPDGTFSYTHNGSENFADSFVYRVEDAVGNATTATVNITITPVNDNAPLVSDKSFTVNEGGTANEGDLDSGTSLLSGLADADLPADSHTVNTTVVTGPSHGGLTLNADGTFSYTHNGSENFADSFVYRVEDAAGNATTATVNITITPVNDNAPTVSDKSFTVNEGGTANEGDLDSGTSLLSGLADADLPTDSHTVNTTVVTGPTHGGLTLNADGTFSYTHNGSENFADSFVYRVEDAAGNATTATVNITITPVNDNAPVVSDKSFTVNEGGTANEGDLDSGTSLLSGLADADLPADSHTVNTTVVTGPSHGGLTLNADGTFSYTHNGSENFADSFVYRVEDAAGNATTATVNITITPVNDNAPLVSDKSFTVTEGGTANESDLDSGTSLLSGLADADLPADSHMVNTTVVTGPTHGGLTLNADGTFSYTHNGSENFADSFVYRVEDAVGNATTATVNITITPVNDNAPIVSDNSLTLNQGGTANEGNLDSGTSLLSGLTDADLPFDAHTVNTTVVTGPTHGGLTLNADGTFSYTHNGTENFADSFVYRVEDAAGNATTATVNITITPVNDNAPTVSDKSFTVNEGGTANESDLDSGTSLLSGLADADLPFDAHTVNTTVVTGPSHGGLTLNADGTFSYTHNGSENFADSFVYRVEDAAGNATTATVNITITPVNDNAPTVSDKSFTVTEGGTATEGDLDSGTSLLSGLTDADLPPDSHTVSTTVATDPSHGLLILNADGTFSYTHSGSENFSDSFVYRIEDGGGNSSSATVFITITPENDMPLAVDDAFTTDEDVPMSGTVAGNDSDIDSTTLTYSLVSSVTNGSLLFNSDGTFTFVAASNFHGSDSFVYELDDGEGGSSTASVSITVAPVNDAPVAVNDGLTTMEDMPVSGNVGNNDSDVDDTLLTYSLATAPSSGTLVFNNDGTYTFTPLADMSGSVVFTYLVADDDGASSLGTVSLTVMPVNDAPNARDDTFTTDEDTLLSDTVASNDTDAESTSMFYSLVAGPTHGNVSLNSDGSFSFNPTAGYSGADSFTYHASDGDGGVDMAEVSLSIRPVNDDPSASDDAFSGTEDQPISGNVGTNDLDPELDTLTFALRRSTSHGALAFFSDGTFTYTPVSDFNGTDSFTYQVADRQGATDTAEVALTVRSVNDVPDAVPDSFSALASSELIIQASELLANDSDADNDAITVQLVLAPANGQITVNPDGSIQYRADDGFAGIDTFAYAVTDGDSISAPASVSVTVFAAPPVDSNSNDNSDSVSTDEADTSTGNGDSAEVAPIPALITSVAGSTADDDDAVVVAVQNELRDHQQDVVDIDQTLHVTKVTPEDELADELTLVVIPSTEVGHLEMAGGRLTSEGELNPIDVVDLKLLDFVQFVLPNTTYEAIVSGMDNLRHSIHNEVAVPELAVEGLVAATSSFSVGAAVWLLEGGYVLASLISALPAWQSFDPIPILAHAAREERDGETVESLFG